MPFGTGQVVTNVGFAVISNRIRNTTSIGSPRYIGMGVGATAAARTAAAGDTALSSEVETRTEGTESQQTTTQTDDTYRVVGVITATAPRSVDEAGLFTAAAAGTMFLSATFAVIALGTNDSLQLTMNCKFA